MDFFEIVTERILEYYPEDLQENSLEKIKSLKELQKAKYRKGVLNEKILSSIVKAEKDLWNDIKKFQFDFSRTLEIENLTLDKNKFSGFNSPWEYIGIEKKIFSYIQNHPELLEKLNNNFPCEKCWNSADEITVFHLDVRDENRNKPRVDWSRGVVKQRKHFKNGIYIYYCSTCGKWGISSKKYNPHG